MQRAFINTLYNLAKNDPNVIWLTSDNGTDYDMLFYRDFPNQYFNVGIAEENQIAMAAGLAACGKTPFAFSGASFMAYRAFEFVRDDVCFQNQNVKIVGFGGGMGISTLGPTHHATEDIGVLRTLPNLTIFSPASPREVEKVVMEAYKINGPVYIRLGMTGEKEIYNEDITFSPKKAVQIKKGEDITFFTTGSIVTEAIAAADMLDEKGIQARIYNVHTLKPFDTDTVIHCAKKGRPIFSIEEHSITGGLGSIIAEIIAENGLNVPFKRIGLTNCFASGYGTVEEMRKINHIDASAIYESVMSTL